MRDHLHKHGRGLVLFGLVGVANTTFDFGVYSVGVLLGVAPALANIIAFAATNPFSYVANSRVTFRSEAGPAALSFRGYGKFLAAHLLSLAISTGLVFWLAPVIGPFLAKALAIAVTVFINYFASALLVFKAGENTGPGS
ncbi:GtrA family protein [Hyphococcus sp.]|uniref:GtrA family protein n=1 Tax=Hyphococcus sp. TaxID=2038636 RepID=UPI0035C6A120